MVSKNAVPAKNLKELIAWIKANEANVTFGTAGVGSGSHFSGLYFQSLIGTKARYVPYRGTGPAMQDLVAGNIDIIVDQASNAMPQVQGGKIRAYAVTATKRIAAGPDIPTVDEAGLPGYHIWLWSGLWVPKGTPKDVIAKLNAAMRAALADAAVLKRFDDLGLEAAAANQQTPEALRAHQKAEADKWWPMIKAAGVTPGLIAAHSPEIGVKASFHVRVRGLVGFASLNPPYHIAKFRGWVERQRNPVGPRKCHIKPGIRLLLPSGPAPSAASQHRLN